MTKTNWMQTVASLALKAAAAPLIGTAILLSSPTHADLQAGVVKYQSGDYKGALEEWKPLAEKGDPNALFNIGQSYRLGRGVPADARTALDYYIRAANLGHVAAQGNAGTLLYFSEAPIRDRAKAVDWWQKASANGDPRAQYMLGVLYFNGEEVEKDWPRAYALTSLAKEAGLAEASSAIEKMDKFLSAEDKAAAATLAPTLKSGTVAPLPENAKPVLASQPAPAPAVAKAVVEKPVVKAAVTPAAPSAGGWRVQIGAFSSESAAERAWGEFQNAHAALKSVAPTFDPASNGAIRLQAGSFASRAGADALCSKLKAEQMSCFVVKPAGQ